MQIGSPRFGGKRLLRHPEGSRKSAGHTGIAKAQPSSRCLLEFMGIQGMGKQENR